jgi:HSP20 family protein
MRIKKNNPVIGRSYSPIKNLFEEFFTISPFEDMLGNVMPIYNNVSADVWEEGDDYYIKMAVPGVDKDKITIEIDADVVRIKGGEKKEEEKEDKGKKYYYRSLNTQFEQTFTLPTVVDADKAEATFKNGIIQIKLPKAESYKPKKISIK